jgi:hypothetical protein
MRPADQCSLALDTEEVDQIRQILRGEAGLEAFRHEGKTGGLERGNFVAPQAADRGVGQLEGEAGSGFAGEQAKELLTVFQGGKVGVVAGLDVEVGIQDVGEDLLWLMRSDGAEVGADGEAFRSMLVAGGAGALVGDAWHQSSVGVLPFATCQKIRHHASRRH